ncbi:hypothetical protein JCM5350_006550 [Sporobolomyces pararoseus]
MSSGALASHYSPSEAVPPELLYSLTQVVYAAGCVNFFLFGWLEERQLVLQDDRFKFSDTLDIFDWIIICRGTLGTQIAVPRTQIIPMALLVMAELDVDPVSQYFLGTLKVSFFTCAVTIGNLVTVAFLDSPRVTIYYSFFLLILPNAWSLSVVWAINQRVLIKRKLKSTISDDASFAQRLEVVGWRNHVDTLRGGANGMTESRRGSIGIDPSKWRGDNETESHSSYRRTWRAQNKPTEPDYGSFELDTTPLDALDTPPHETRVSGIWVKTETKIETAPA